MPTLHTPTPQGVDLLVRQRSITVRSLRATLPAHCFKLDEPRAWRTLARTLALLALGQVALAWLPLEAGPALLWQVPALLALQLFVAFGFVGLFVIGHDCGHFSFSRSRAINLLVGHVCMGLLMTGLSNWILGHNHHHKFPNIRKKDTNWPENMVTAEELAQLPKSDQVGLRLAYGTALGFILGYWIGLVRYAWLPSMYPQIPLRSRDRSAIRLSNLVTLVLSGGAAALLLWLGGPGALVRHYGVPFFFAAAMGAFITLVHHSSESALVFDEADWTPERGQLVSTFNVRYPAWAEALILDINIHLPHHVAPSMPWYRLREANEALRALHPECVQERPLSLHWLREMWKRPVLARDGDRYRFVQLAAEPVVVPIEG